MPKYFVAPDLLRGGFRFAVLSFRPPRRNRVTLCFCSAVACNANDHWLRLGGRSDGRAERWIAVCHFLTIADIPALAGSLPDGTLSRKSDRLLREAGKSSLMLNQITRDETILGVDGYDLFTHTDDTAAASFNGNFIKERIFFNLAPVRIGRFLDLQRMYAVILFNNDIDLLSVGIPVISEICS